MLWVFYIQNGHILPIEASYEYGVCVCVCFGLQPSEEATSRRLSRQILVTIVLSANVRPRESFFFSYSNNNKNYDDDDNNNEIILFMTFRPIRILTVVSERGKNMPKVTIQ